MDDNEREIASQALAWAGGLIAGIILILFLSQCDKINNEYKLEKLRIEKSVE